MLKYYVYIYSDPNTNEVFYVGKGKGNRVFQHLIDSEKDQEHEKSRKIQEIISKGQEPIIEILIHGIDDEKTALRVESSIIDLLGKSNLTNKVSGWKSGIYGRMDVEKIAAMYEEEEVEITEPSLLIKINNTFHYGMSTVELYDATRCCWNLNETRKDKIEYAFAVFDGIIQEVYKVEAWFKGNITLSSLKYRPSVDDTRWEFVGQIAPDNIRSKYIHKSVTKHWLKGAQNPIKYLNI